MSSSNKKPRRPRSYEIQEEIQYRVERSFWDACENNHIERIEEMLRSGTANLKDTRKWVRIFDHTDACVVRLLLDNGADPNEIQLSGAPYLRRELMDLLIEYGWDVTGKGPQLLIDMIHDREWVDWIISKGIDLNARTEHIRQVLHREHDNTVGCLNIAATKGDIELFDYFVSHGADPSRSIALHYASFCPDPLLTTKMIVHLIERYKMDPVGSHDCNGLRYIYTLVGTNSEGWTGTPMDFAMWHVNPAAVETLWWYGVDAKEAVKWAARKGLVEILRVLLKGGKREDAAKGALLAVEYGLPDVLEICKEFGAKEEDWKDAEPGKYVSEDESEYEVEAEDEIEADWE